MLFTNAHFDDTVSKLTSAGVHIVQSEMGGRDLAGVLAELKSNDIQSVLVEGGAEVAGTFCDERLVDKVTFITTPMIIGGREAPMAIGGAGAATLEEAFKLTNVTVTEVGQDLEITGYPAA
jgi:diaminohydroxyphosphoribosylaminopyrimidine deaminase/5-amino-6-(5-phosphoribosylamino)uracil reductase